MADGGKVTSGTDRLRRQIQTAHRAASEVDVQVKAYAVGRVLDNPRQAAVGLAVRCLCPDTDREVRTDGGVHTPDPVGDERSTSLRTALTWVLEARRRARDSPVPDAAIARLQLATCGVRLAFFATSDEERAVGVHDAAEHLERVVEAVDDEHVGEPVRRALQLFAWSRDGDAA